MKHLMLKDVETRGALGSKPHYYCRDPFKPLVTTEPKIFLQWMFKNSLLQITVYLHAAFTKMELASKMDDTHRKEMFSRDLSPRVILIPTPRSTEDASAFLLPNVISLLERMEPFNIKSPPISPSFQAVSQWSSAGRTSAPTRSLQEVKKIPRTVIIEKPWEWDHYIFSLIWIHHYATSLLQRYVM